MPESALNRMFLALSDPGRRAMVEYLSLRPATVTQLAEPLGMRLPSAVKHLKILENGGFVVSRKSGRERTYRLRVEAMRTIGEWVSNREAAWHAAFDRLETAIQEVGKEERST